MLKERILTALVLLPIILVAIFYFTQDFFALFMGAFVLTACWEWTNLAGVMESLWRGVYCAAVAVFMLLLYLFPQYWLNLVVIVWWALALALVVTYPASAGLWSGKKGLLLLVGLVVLIPAWYGLISLRSTGFVGTSGPWALLYCFVLIFGADTGAYFAGRAFGQRKLAPAVSPGKSIEGLLGGMVLTMLIAVWVGITLDLQGSMLVSFLLLSFVTVLVSALGDLLESMLKRERGIKDSGNILPGHGGMMDRIDSITAAVPVFVAGLSLLDLY